MKYSIKILESNQEITNAINKALLRQVVTFMDGAFNELKQNLPSIITTAITNAPEYNSLIRGTLRYHLGLVDAGSKIDGLINIWINNIEYNYSPPIIRNNKISSKFSANLIRADLSDVLYSEYAQMIDTYRGYSLPWLEWLLLDGTQNLVDNYEIVIGPNKYSRTGYAIMKPSSGSWSVPSEFAGTITDNWITRAIQTSETDINNLLRKIFSP